MLSPVKWAEVCFTSAKTGQRCTKVGKLPKRKRLLQLAALPNNTIIITFFQLLTSTNPPPWFLTHGFICVCVAVSEEHLRGHGVVGVHSPENRRMRELRLG